MSREYGRIETFITRIDRKWYAFGMDLSRCRVMSVGSDSPGRGRWVSWFSADGVRQVSCPSRSRRAARKKAERNGIYQGRV